MKAVKLYVCDVCHTQYADKEKAKRCETNHKTKIENVKPYSYKPVTMQSDGYPLKIDIKFSNGEVITYRR